MTDSTFGDWEPADSYTPDNVPDPLAVAQRIHDIRGWLAAMSVSPEEQAAWGDLEPGEQEVGYALSRSLIEHLMDKGRDGSALSLHEARQFLGEQATWRDLDADAQAVALGLVDDIVRWLQIEGTVIK
jgi:hypothetical protein